MPEQSSSQTPTKTRRTIMNNEVTELRPVEITWSSAWKIGCAVWGFPILVGLAVFILMMLGMVQF